MTPSNRSNQLSGEQGGTTVVEKKQTTKLLAKLASWPAPYREVGERIHQIVLDAVPALRPKLWYGEAGYAVSGPVQIFFRVDQYMSFGLTEKAQLSVDDGAPDLLIESAWFIKELDGPTEKRIAAIVCVKRLAE
ncbi:hypothetical protein GCM10007304_35080 [Rhodococcoides trifolii]|uniref:YdhG-like domain-containing protein n=1 Tax=Rhodococcoides trifolii TaxID=908250 RepID=A0A917G1C1_9NOCA|nr:DUF1801 domain-containing protein [Rhodococcus trifolii]GGG17973.1 hypothetical protein GCM10007304_35080 [Rhodococcus trifolii]